MNNQMPYLGMNPNENIIEMFPHNQGNLNEMMFERLNNRIIRLERRVKMIENKINMINGNPNPTFLKNNQEDDSMYMI